VGVETDTPVLTEAARRAGFTNERGIDGTTRFLRNVMGLWLLQESVRTWEARGARVDLGELMAAAGVLTPLRSLFDVDRPELLAPGDMPARIALACDEAGYPAPEGQAATTRAILDSLAVAYRRAVRRAEVLTGVTVSSVHLVGGGVHNTLLCQLTADACGVPVVAGPVEAAALGNALVQARALGVVPEDRWALRRLVASGAGLARYEPSLARTERFDAAERCLPG
jgi:rhamnulokinase